MTLSATQNNKVKLLVHLHLYYPEQIAYMICKLKNIADCSWDLYVTVCQKDAESERKLLEFKPDCKIIEVKNIGYDIYPFIQVLNAIKLEDYDYVLKIHTKNYRKSYPFPHCFKKGFEWRNELIEAMLKNKSRFKKILKLMKNPKIGMMYSDYYDADYRHDWLPEESSLLDDEIKKLSIKEIKKFRYVAGTMFIAKTDIFNLLKERRFDDDSFRVNNQTGCIGTLSHVYERLFGILVYESGYEILTVNNRTLKERLFSFESIFFKTENNLNILGCQLKFKNHNNSMEWKYKNNLRETIFSIKNEKSKNKVHKVITIFGFKFKMKKSEQK